MPSHYLNQCWNIVNWTLRNKFQLNFYRNAYIFIQENALENGVCEMAAFLSGPQCVKGWMCLQGEHVSTIHSLSQGIPKPGVTTFGTKRGLTPRISFHFKFLKILATYHIIHACGHSSICYNLCIIFGPMNLSPCGKVIFHKIQHSEKSKKRTREKKCVGRFRTYIKARIWWKAKILKFREKW